VTLYDSVGSNGFVTLASGYTTVNVADPDHPLATGALPTASAAGQAIAVNGSGIALTVGQDANGPAVNVFGSGDPNNVTQFVTRFSLPSPALDVAIGEGIGFVADGSGGLQVINYLPFDPKGVPPAVSIASPVTGSSVAEGSAIPILVTASDDVQVRNVELLVNGEVVANAVSAPFEFTVTVPTLASGATSLSI